jgi:hypothetical protein
LRLAARVPAGFGSLAAVAVFLERVFADLFAGGSVFAVVSRGVFDLAETVLRFGFAGSAPTETSSAIASNGSITARFVVAARFTAGAFAFTVLFAIKTAQAATYEYAA